MAYDPLLLLDKFIIEGYHFEDLPGEWEQVSNDGFGVRRQTYPTADNKRQVVINKPLRTDELSFADKRKISTQAFRAGWSLPDSYCSRCMYDHLVNLYSLQKTFYIQYDDVMTYDPTSPAVLQKIGVQTRAYYTPTFPIKPFGWTPLDATTWALKVYVNNIPVNTDSFTVDEDSGMIQFRGPLLVTDVVTAVYTWRMYVQVADFNLIPAPGEIAQELYVGSVVFEQVSKPAGAPDNWYITLPCMDPSNNVPSLSAPALSLPSVPINPTEYLSYGNFDSMLSIFSEPLDTTASDPSHASWPSEGSSIADVTENNETYPSYGVSDADGEPPPFPS
jgi:hypothetical protein